MGEILALYDGLEAIYQLANKLQQKIYQKYQNHRRQVETTCLGKRQNAPQSVQYRIGSIMQEAHNRVVGIWIDP
jgi:hypothetical protein